MATTTTNLGLTLPTGTENVSLSVLNGNMGLIDSFAGTMAGHTGKTYSIDATINSTGSSSYARLIDQWSSFVAYVKTLTGLTSGFVSVNGFVSFPAYSGSTNLGVYYVWGVLALYDAAGTIFMTQYHNNDEVYMIKAHTSSSFDTFILEQRNITNPRYVQIPKNSSVTLTTQENATALMTTMYGAADAFRGAWLVFGTASSYTPGLTVLQAPNSASVVVTANANGTVTIQNKSTNYPLNVQITLMKVTGSNAQWSFA